MAIQSSEEKIIDWLKASPENAVMLQTFVHDMRVPIANIIGGIGLLRDDSQGLSEEDRQRILDILQKSVENLQQVTDVISVYYTGRTASEE